MPISITLPDVFLTFNRRDFHKYEDDFELHPGGVYVFHNEEGACIYVGKSKILATRLRTHFASSPFASEIATVTIYAIDNPLEREIYETYAINTLGGIYNKAKIYGNGVSNPLIADEIDTLTYELEALEKEREGIAEDLRQVEGLLHPPVPKMFANITNDISTTYYDYVDFYMPDVHSEKLAQEEHEFRRLTHRLSEVDEEVSELNDRISEYLSSLIT